MVSQDEDKAQPEGLAVVQTVDEKDREIGDDELDTVVGGLTPVWGGCTDGSCPSV